MKKYLKQFGFAGIVLATVSGTFWYFTMEKFVDLGNDWQSYRRRSIGLTVKIPKNTVLKRYNAFWAEFPINAVSFSDGVFKIIHSSKYIGVGSIEGSNEEEVRRNLATNRNSDLSITKKTIDGKEVFFVTTSHKENEIIAIRLYVTGQKYLHYADINLDYINKYNKELKSMSFDEKNERYIEIVSEYLLDIEPF